MTLLNLLQTGRSLVAIAAASPKHRLHLRNARFYSTPAMRFIQFQRTSAANDAAQAGRRLGLLSEDGSQMVDLTAQCPHMKDMIGFITAGDVAMQKLQAKLGDFKWQPLSADVQLLAPVTSPEKIICIGLNYLGHCQEQNKEAPTDPMFFSKFNNTLVGPTGDVIAHKVSQVSAEFLILLIILSVVSSTATYIK